MYKFDSEGRRTEFLEAKQFINSIKQPTEPVVYLHDNEILLCMSGDIEDLTVAIHQDGIAIHAFQKPRNYSSDVVIITSNIPDEYLASFSWEKLQGKNSLEDIKKRLENAKLSSKDGVFKLKF